MIALLRWNDIEENIKKRLELLKRQHKQREYEKHVAFEKERLISEHFDFTKYYQFSEQGEANRINSVLNRLPDRYKLTNREFRRNGIMCLFVEVTFFAGQRRTFPQTDYRPDAIFNKSRDYWGITFVELHVNRFDVPTPAIIKFTFQDCHYKEVHIGQKFLIMEGIHQVGEGEIILIDTH